MKLWQVVSPAAGRTTVELCVRVACVLGGSMYVRGRVFSQWGRQLLCYLYHQCLIHHHGVI